MDKSGISDWIGLEISEGRYQIEEAIGQGSMGQVFTAFDRHLETTVVLKFPVSQEFQPENQEFLDRFSREARSLVTLSHPHVVKVHGRGRVPGACRLWSCSISLEGASRIGWRPDRAGSFSPCP